MFSICCVFFFCKQKPEYEIYRCDWCSAVCSSDPPLHHHANVVTLLLGFLGGGGRRESGEVSKPLAPPILWGWLDDVIQSITYHIIIITRPDKQAGDSF